MVALSGAAISGICIVAGIVIARLVYRIYTRPAWSGREEPEVRRGSSEDTRLIGKRCSVCGEPIHDPSHAESCLDCELAYHLVCEEEHRCHQEWVAEDN